MLSQVSELALMADKSPPAAIAERSGLPPWQKSKDRVIDQIDFSIKDTVEILHMGQMQSFDSYHIQKNSSLGHRAIDATYPDPGNDQRCHNFVQPLPIKDRHSLRKSASKTMISDVIATNHPFSGNILS